jgi:hypothetical protein
MNTVDAISSWCSNIMSDMVSSDISFDSSAEIGRVIVPTSVRVGDILEQGEHDDEDVFISAKDFSENDYRLSHHGGYLVSHLIKLGALEVLASRLGSKICVTIRSDGIKSLAYEKFATRSVNPEEKYVVRCAYARTRMTIRATYYEHGVPEFIRAASEAICASF